MELRSRWLVFGLGHQGLKRVFRRQRFLAGFAKDLGFSDGECAVSFERSGEDSSRWSRGVRILLLLDHFEILLRSDGTLSDFGDVKISARREFFALSLLRLPSALCAADRELDRTDGAHFGRNRKGGFPGVYVTFCR